MNHLEQLSGVKYNTKNRNKFIALDEACRTNVQMNECREDDFSYLKRRWKSLSYSSWKALGTKS